MRQLAEQDKLIIEGGNTRTYLDRVRRTDTIIWLAPPKWHRAYRVFRRDDMCFNMLKWTLRYDYVFGPNDDSALKAAGDTAKCIEVQTSKDLSRLLHHGIRYL